MPDHAAVRRTALTRLEYDPDVTDAARLAQVKVWGQWATARAVGAQRRRPLQPLRGRPLRVGYVSTDLLKQYADIDIPLDPFPFTGGLPSGEALWMGVPVVTCPQSQVVSRQTHALLHQIGLPELSATDADDYVRIATQLASIQFVDNELVRLQAQAAALQTGTHGLFQSPARSPASAWWL